MCGRLPSVERQVSKRFSRFITVHTCHRQLRRVRMPRLFISAAMARRLVAPPLRMSSTTACRSSAWRSALRAIAARSAAPPLPARLRAAAPLGLPSLIPRAGGCQRLLRAPGDGLALLPRDQRHDPDRQVVGLRHVGGDEPDAAVPVGAYQALSEVRTLKGSPRRHSR
jgi:hypothetical protein